MADTTICPECKHVNAPGVVECVRCGTFFGDNTTLAATDKPLTIKRPEFSVDEQADMDVFFFYVAGGSEQHPLVHRGQSNVVLGRKSNTPVSEAFIDLTDYSAHALGVSRQHARIIYYPRGYSIEDLGSANGTWVNGNKLDAHSPQRLRRGDHIQLGEMIIFVYFFHSAL